MALTQNYHEIWFESFNLSHTSGHRNERQLKPVEGQELPAEVSDVCSQRKVDPFSLLIECDQDLADKFVLKTKFLFKTKLTDRKGKGLFFYTHYSWKPLDIVTPNEA